MANNSPSKHSALAQPREVNHLRVAVSMAKVLDELGIVYVVGGSVASSIIGEPRSTIDVDIAVRLDSEQLDSLLGRVRPSFYVPEADAARAVREHDSFNLIHNDHSTKIDLFVLGDGVLDTNQIARRIRFALPIDPPADLWITAVEDQVLRKLDWYRRGGMVSDRQWRDVTAMLRVNRDRIDDVYLNDTAQAVGLTALLGAARAQV